MGNKLHRLTRLANYLTKSRPVTYHMSSKSKFTEAELRAKLTPEQYEVTQNHGTERPFTGKYDNFYKAGHYNCVVCSEKLFESEKKFNAGCGWPAFWGGQKHMIEEIVDTSFGMRRVEVRCKNCGAHLGHVFNDGPKDKGGMRYCINAASMDFVPAGN